MLESVLNIYDYKDKSCLTSLADTILYPASRTFCGKRFIYFSDTNSFIRHDDEKAHSIFFRIISAIVAIILLPLALLASIIKGCNQQNRSVHESYLEVEKNQQPQELQKKQSGTEQSSRTPSTNKPAPKPEKPACAICFDDYDPTDSNLRTLEICNHVFHKTCIDPWLNIKRHCPICRMDVPLDNPVRAPVNNNPLPRPVPAPFISGVIHFPPPPHFVQLPQSVGDRIVHITRAANRAALVSRFHTSSAYPNPGPWSRPPSFSLGDPLPYNDRGILPPSFYLSDQQISQLSALEFEPRPFILPPNFLRDSLDF